jgi:hypothetical protein
MIKLSRVTLRMPKDVHDWLVRSAASNLSSVNSEIVRALRKEMKEADGRKAA